MGTVTTNLRDNPFGPASSVPLVDGLIAATGISLLYARQDHVHPIDTSRAPLNSPTFTGVPAAPTAAVGTSTTQLATTAFVDAEAVAKAGDTMTGALIISAVGGLTLTASSAGIEMGLQGTTNTPFIDFHSSANVIDYDARIMASGGSASIGQGTLTVTAATFTIGSAASVGTTLNVGGATTCSGNLAVSKATPVVQLNKTASGQDAGFIGTLNGTTRWFISAGDQTAESGGNIGSDLSLYRYTDAGAFIGSALTLSRATGYAIFANGITVSAASQFTGNLTVANGDLTTYRAGGTSGVIFLNSAATRYLFYDGTSYQMPTAALAVGGAVVAGGGMSSTGYTTRTGVSGSFGGSAFNMAWTGSATQLWIDNTNTGVITVTSDYRIKKDVTDAAPALAEVLKWRPITYTGKAWGIFEENAAVRHSFIAHELQAISSDCVVGEKDGEQPQSLDLVPIVVRLAKAIQELSAELATVKAAVATGGR